MLGVVLAIGHDGRGVRVRDAAGRVTEIATLSQVETLDRPPTERLTVSTADGHKGCRCPAGLVAYRLSETEHPPVCDFCGTAGFAPGTRLYGCRRCDTDACVSCFKPQPSFVSCFKCLAVPTQKASLSNGTLVTTKKLSRADLNDRMASVIRFDESNGRYTIQFTDGDRASVSVLPSKIEVVHVAPVE